MRLIDRYIIREIVLPFLIALVVLTFLLIIPFIIEQAEQLIAKGVAWPIISRLMLTLVPAQLGLTIPMALLIAILVAFGRLSGDREIVVMMACGISPLRLLRPVLLVSILGAGATLWVMIESIPDANQTFREITLRIVADRAEGQVRAREFFADFPDTVLYVREIPATGGWKDVFAADTRNPTQPIVYLARTGRMIVDREKRTIDMVLEDGSRHTTNAKDPSIYEVVSFKQLIVSLDPESVFPRTGPARGEREMTVTELQVRIAELKGQNLPYHNPVMEIQKKFSLPAACLVFALVGVGLGISNRRDGKLASFVLGIAVIFIYYVAMFTSGAMTKGALIPAWLAMWVPNILLTAAGVVLILLRSRGIDHAQLRLPALPWLRARFGADAGAPGGATGPGQATPARRRGTVIVIRVPQFQLPRPNLLDLYIARTYVRMLVLCIVGLMGVFYISTFIDLSDKLFKGQVSLSMILTYLWWATPQFLYYIIAIAALLAAIVTIGVLTKNSELIVMRACGISIYRTALPLMVFAATGQRGALRLRGADPGGHQPPRRFPPARHPRRECADIRCSESQVAARPGRRGLSLSVLRPDATGAECGLGVPLRSLDAGDDRARLRHASHLRGYAGHSRHLGGAHRLGARLLWRQRHALCADHDGKRRVRAGRLLRH